MERNKLRDMIAESDNIVFFGGAGVSTESGIPDFRSADGLYNQTYQYPPEQMLSRSFFLSHTAEFYAFYREKLLAPNNGPNKAHCALARLEQMGKLRAVITQNIDGLHQLAGSGTVLELHGSVHRNLCMDCGKNHSIERIAQGTGVPKCDCGGTIKPDVVLYEEYLDADTLTRATRAIAAADMLIIGGTSLAVYPAAGLVREYSGSRLVLINRSPTPYDSDCDLLLTGSVGEILHEAVPRG